MLFPTARQSAKNRPVGFRDRGAGDAGSIYGRPISLHPPYNLEEIDRFLPRHALQLDFHAGIPQVVDIVNVAVAQKNGRGTANLAILVIDIADIQIIEMESEAMGRPGIGDLAEKNDGLRSASPVKGILLSKLGNAADDDLDPAGDRHPNHRLAKKIGGHFIIHHEDRGNFKKRDPSLQNLSMDQTIVNPHKGYIQ
jgi:hypothetical protein